MVPEDSKATSVNIFWGGKMLEYLLGFIYHKSVIKNASEVDVYLVFICLLPWNKINHSNNPKQAEIRTK